MSIFLALYSDCPEEGFSILGVCSSFVKAADVLEARFEEIMKEHADRIQRGAPHQRPLEEFRKVVGSDEDCALWEIEVWDVDGKVSENVTTMTEIRKVRAVLQREALAKFKGRTPQEFRDLFFSLNDDDRVVMMQEHYDWINTYKNDNPYLKEVFEWWKKFVTRGLTLMKEGGSDDAQQGDSDSG